MEERVSMLIKHKDTDVYLKYQIFELLVVALFCTFLTWYFQFLWTRRKLYNYSKKLPGPFAFPLLGSAHHFIGSPYDIFSSIMKLFNNYPGIFRVWFGPRLFYGISDPKYYDVLLTKCLSKEEWYNFAEPVVGHGLFTAPYSTWKKHRKIIMPTFNQKILNRFIDIFSEQSEILVEQLKKIAGRGEFDIFDVVSKCTLDIICETAMGVKVNAQLREKDNVATWIDTIMETVFLRIFILWNHIDAIFYFHSISAPFYTSVKNLHDFTSSVIREKKRLFEETGRGNVGLDFEEGSKKKAFLDYLIEITSQGDSKFTENELRDEVTTFIIAGSDTTASTNSFAFIMLGIHKNMQEKIYEEIIEAVGPDKSIEEEDLPKLRYMERFLKETLRLFPVAPFIVRAIEEDIDIGDHTVPGGISVIFSIYTTHTNQKYWPDPYKFDPDRFLPEEVAKRYPCSYIPFSYGPRNCIGMKYAMMAMKALLATVLRKFKVSTSYKNVQDVKLKANLVLRPKNGYKVSLELR